jgi:hypothetical protein
MIARASATASSSRWERRLRPHRQPRIAVREGDVDVPDAYVAAAPMTPLYRAPGAITGGDHLAAGGRSRRAEDPRTATRRGSPREGRRPGRRSVNRTDAIAFMGGAQNTNEECYCSRRRPACWACPTWRHQAGFDTAPRSPVWGPLRTGGDDNHWIDLQHCKSILVEGSNVAENHPMAYIVDPKAQENGARIIHVDPRFNPHVGRCGRTTPASPGTDAASSHDDPPTSSSTISMTRSTCSPTPTRCISAWDFAFEGGRVQRLRRRAPQVRHGRPGRISSTQQEAAGREEPRRPALRLF